MKRPTLAWGLVIELTVTLLFDYGQRSRGGTGVRLCGSRLDDFVNEPVLVVVTAVSWMNDNPNLGASCKTGCECRPSGPARAIGAGRADSNLSGFLHNANFA
jgi:hypothetical protein